MSRPSTKRSDLPKPGFTIQKVLLGEVPLVNGQYVKEASINDIHAAYTKLISDWNSANLIGEKMRGMSTASFYSMFRLAKDLGLVECIREEPMVSPPPNGKLYSIRKNPNGEVRAVTSRRRIFRLTSKGQTEHSAWNSLIRTWLNDKHKDQPPEHPASV